MPIAIAHSYTFIGIDAVPIRVETHISNGLPKFCLVGLAETAVKESKERVRSAIINVNLKFPNRRITVNLSPADLPKAGSAYDLAIALSILCASGQLKEDSLRGHAFIGELSLTGEIRSLPTVLPAIISKSPKLSLIIPKANEEQAQLTKEKNVYLACNLNEVIAFLCQDKALSEPTYKPIAVSQTPLASWSDIKGQSYAKRGVEIALSGGHHCLLYGPPGSGKTLMASATTSICPPLSNEQLLEVVLVSSLSKQNNPSMEIAAIPFRAPHHSASMVSLIGGGTPIKPGEISLAHHGILFLDELPEFQRQSLEALREPLGAGVIHISRVNQQVQYPAKFQLISAFNPCPCGYYNHPRIECRCTSLQIERYQSKLSGPLLDRMALFIDVAPITLTQLQSAIKTESNETVKERISKTRQKQFNRQFCLNHRLDNKQIKRVIQLDKKIESELQKIADKLCFSARQYYQLLRVARTIADIADSNQVQKSHISEALLYRKKTHFS